MTVIVFAVAILTFLLGFHLGFKWETKPIKEEKREIKVVEENSELKNFFSYDGTEQL